MKISSKNKTSQGLVPALGDCPAADMALQVGQQLRTRTIPPHIFLELPRSHLLQFEHTLTHTHTHFTHSESITNCCWPREWNNGQGSIMNMPSVGEGGQEVGVEWPCRFILFTRCMQCISTHLPTMHIKVISLYHHRLSVAQFAATFPDVPFWP